MMAKAHAWRRQTKRLEQLLRQHGIEADVEELTPKERQMIDDMFPH